MIHIHWRRQFTMNADQRYNFVSLNHHLRDDVVVLLPHVAYSSCAAAFGDAAIVLCSDTDSLGSTILQMLAHCATADAGPLQAKREAARERQRRGFELTHDEQIPSFGQPDNWGRIYERYPEVLLHPMLAGRYFSTATVSDREGPAALLLEQLHARRKDRGIYTPGASRKLNGELDATSIGEEVAACLQSWRPKRSLLTRLIA